MASNNGGGNNTPRPSTRDKDAPPSDHADHNDHNDDGSRQSVEQFPPAPGVLPSILTSAPTVDSIAVASPLPLTPNPASSTGNVSSRLFPPRDRRSSKPPVHVHYALNLDTNVSTPQLVSSSEPIPAIAEVPSSPDNPASPIIRRRLTRSATFTPVEDFDNLKPEGRMGWQPGAEPGLDPLLPDGGQESTVPLHAECNIQVTDFSQDDLVMHHVDNATLGPFLNRATPGWVKCRWINVNGLSWDVIQVLGRAKKLHKLALEDVVGAENRTKTDWYSNHAFMVLTLQRLVHILDDSSDSGSDSGEEEEEEEGEEEDDEEELLANDGDNGEGVGFAGRFHDPLDQEKQQRRRPGPRPGPRPTPTIGEGSTHSTTIGGVRRSVTRMFKSGRPDRLGTFKSMKNPDSLVVGKNPHHQQQQPMKQRSQSSLKYRTLHTYHATPNDARNRFMDKHSVLSARNYAVSAEQVSLFITNDNTIISIFETSAGTDLQRPILARLSSPDTVMRQACDASMVAQAIIDAIIDIAMPVASLYTDVIGDLELDVLTHPDVKQARMLYIMTTEINKIMQFITPISNMITSLRDHKSAVPSGEVGSWLQDPSKGVIITPMTTVYFRDVLDHCSMIGDSLCQVQKRAEGLIDLIFNTLAAGQNDTMKILTNVTIAFLPLTFITGYFGQNFEPFEDTKRGIYYFWQVAAPTAIATVFVLMFPIIKDWVVSVKDRARIHRFRAKRKKRDEKRRRKYISAHLEKLQQGGAWGMGGGNGRWVGSGGGSGGQEGRMGA